MHIVSMAPKVVQQTSRNRGFYLNFNYMNMIRQLQWKKCLYIFQAVWQNRMKIDKKFRDIYMHNLLNPPGNNYFFVFVDHL